MWPGIAVKGAVSINRMTHALTGVRAKIERANEHLTALASELERGLGSEYGIFAEQDPNVPDQVHFRVRVPPDLMIRYGLIVGDVVHNLRSALDHLAWQLVVVNGREPTRHTAFPICRSRAEYAKRSPLMLDGMHPIATTKIERLQPYNAEQAGTTVGNHALSVLKGLDNRDKHRVVQVAVLNVPGYRVILGTKRPVDFEALARSGAGAMGPLKDGTIIRTLAPGSVPTNMDVNFQAAISIGFEQSGPGHGWAIRATLQELSTWVAGIVEDVFVPLFWPELTRPR